MKLSHFFAVIALTAGASSVQGQTSTLNTVPEGITTFNIPATQAGQSTSSYFSAPLCNDPVYTGAVESISTVTASAPDTITVGDTPAPWTGTNYGSTSTTPYFVKFLSGTEAGRVIQVLSNTPNSLTLDTTDGTHAQATALNTANFAVAAGDTFEVFPGDTLALMFGSSNANLVLDGGGVATADVVTIYSRAAKRLIGYYFDSTAGFWKEVGNSVNANNTLIYPYGCFVVGRRQSHAASSFTLTGRVAEVNHLIQTGGNQTSVYDSSGYPVDIKLSQLQLANWTKATIPALPAQPTIATADTIAIWNPSANRFDIYFELTDNTWRKYQGTTSDVSSTVIPAGTTVSFLKRTAVTGAASYLTPMIPYSLTQ